MTETTDQTPAEEPTVGPRCGNNPNVRLTDGDRKAVAEFRAYLTDRAVLRERITEVLVTTSREEWPYTPGQEKWDYHKHGDRPGHTYAISCALCTNDVDRLAAAVLAVLPAPADDFAATTCSAQYHGHDEARLCIRAAQHTGKAHTDEHGFHWSDTVAVYPLDDGTFRTGINLRAALRGMAGEAQQPETQADDEPTESVIYEVVGDWGVDSADSAEGARAAVAKWLRAYPKCGAYAQQRVYREWPDGSEFYGPWTDLPAAVSQPGKEA